MGVHCLVIFHLFLHNLHPFSSHFPSFILLLILFFGVLLMAEELVQDWEKLKLTEEEDVVVGKDFDNSVDEESRIQISLTLVGKLLTSKPFNVEAMKRTLMAIWRLKENVSIRMVDTNLFIFHFFCGLDKDRVLDGCPWCFDNQILLLKEMQVDEQPS